MNPKVLIKNFGCKVNLSDGHSLAYEFSKRGYQLTEDPRQAHITVLNTCSVTQKAEKTTRHYLRRYAAQNPPRALRIITGCYAQINSRELIEMPEVNYVIPNEAKGDLVSTVHRLMMRHSVDHQTSATTGHLPASKEATLRDKFPHHLRPVRDNRQGHFKSATAYFAPQLSAHTRAFLKIQDGCNDFCAYCQIPWARGASRSVPPDEILSEVQRLLENGIREIVLTGIHIGEWGRELKDTPELTSLLDQMAHKLRAYQRARLRLSSLEPFEFRPELKSWISQNPTRISHHFHFPMQSGSSRVLKLMGRQYTAPEYLRTVTGARNSLSSHRVHLSADVMVGFPGEQDNDFQSTVDMIEQCQLTSLHVFPYSKRPRTRALKMPGHVPREVIKQRSAILLDISKRRLTSFYESSIGEDAEVLWEQRLDDHGRRLGKTSHYLTVCAPKSQDPGPGALTLATLKGLAGAHKILATPL